MVVYYRTGTTRGNHCMITKCAEFNYTKVDLHLTTYFFAVQEKFGEWEINTKHERNF